MVCAGYGGVASWVVVVVVVVRVTGWNVEEDEMGPLCERPGPTWCDVAG